MINNFHAAKEGFKRAFILNSISENSGNIGITAKKLGIHRQTIHIIIDSLGIKKEVKGLKARFKRYNDPGIERNKNNLYREAVHSFEKEYLKNFLAKTGGFVTKAARDIGVHRNSIILKVIEHNLYEYINTVRKSRRAGKRI